MKAMVVKAAKGPLVAEERALPVPGADAVRIRVHACGVCHSDLFTTDGLWPGLALPRIAGHEVAGVIDAVGAGVTRLAVGDRVGVGWHGGHDGTCRNCLRGKFIHCEHAAITGITTDGGYAEYMTAPAVAVARIPDGMDFAAAAPLMCAGVTTFNALRRSAARPGDLVAVHGLGGLGHLGVQYARAMGFETVAIARGAGKEAFAAQLGAHHYIDSEHADVAAALQKLGGAQAILATAPSGKAMGPLVAGLGVEGALLIVAAPFDPLQVAAAELIGGDRRVQGWASGTAADSSEAMTFAQQSGVRAMIEPFPLAQAQAALEHMTSGKVRFRAVLEMSGA
ncbi:MAG: alcohol dehydrogenase catalytic domain-containing protein [Candidatus Binatia bacterium]